ncbi:hypothetical protein B4N89_29445 [Embleya scabrispora]|uniref:Uncharacterized protein n=1 Tax=Embleya scabrispora TaxID=159449 RepID=A0A1T3P627_9ACTN|nr:hypothetical protein B4N89_29445 [Embleya scabrispora]
MYGSTPVTSRAPRSRSAKVASPLPQARSSTEADNPGSAANGPVSTSASTARTRGSCGLRYSAPWRA